MEAVASGRIASVQGMSVGRLRVRFVRHLCDGGPLGPPICVL